MWGHTKLMTVLRYIWVRCRQHTHQHLSTGVFPQTFAGAVYNVCILGCKRYTWRLQTLSLSDACICHVGRTYVQERLQVLASEFGPNRLVGCSALQDGSQCTAGRVALHCRTGCTALRGGLQCTAWKTTLFLPASRIMS